MALGRYCWQTRFESLNPTSYLLWRKQEVLGVDHSFGTSAPLSQLPHFSLLKDCKKAAARIIEAMNRHEKICIFADYDVDGTTAAALLRRYFSEINYPVEVYIPERLIEGYGVNPIGLRKLHERGVKLVITVDNGISAVQACRVAQELQIDVIITDHHELGETLPQAFAIVNPKQKDCLFPFKMLAGVGVAFYLLIALRDNQKQNPNYNLVNLRSYLDLVAIGTIADVAPLNGVNHILTKVGLQVLNEHLKSGRRPGVHALLRQAGWEDDNPVSEYDVAFKVAPRLNACGRLGTAVHTELLLSTNGGTEALSLARHLHDENSQRQLIEKEIRSEAEKHVLSMDKLPDALVLHNSEWHPGVVGIVAQRIMEQFYRPTLVLGTLDGKIKGSGRSVHNFDLFLALNKVRDEFISFGGHFHAVGLTMEPHKLPWLSAYLAEQVRLQMKMNEQKAPLIIECPVDFSVLDDDFLFQLESFGPFGMGNSRPRWLLPSCVIKSFKPLGKDASHAKLRVEDKAGFQKEVMYFGGSEWAQQHLESKVDLVFEAKPSYWRGRIRMDYFLVDAAL